ncbi:hypothetical protein NET02_09450 [Thermomicrobiaceae bacterium CFH 74404]|uniref:Uncharacterized protein n=1 Tax=Thermalbibacter longus TaxID=2951981 RepID=A0AA42BB52_9BACT|nr:hypothetical protein [Thermalbibacter longus]MCM8749370.1 hypothetical protein [Thermalbibacter longus]
MHSTDVRALTIVLIAHTKQSVGVNTISVPSMAASGQLHVARKGTLTMNLRPCFGVLEVPWELALASPAGKAPREGTLLSPDALGSLPLKPFVLTHSTVTQAQIQHRLFTIMLTQVEPDGFRKPVPVDKLVSWYAIDGARLLALSQYVPPPGNSVVYRVAAGMTRRVMVGTSQGLFIQGRWYADYGSTVARWQPNTGATLLWSIPERAFELYGEGFTEEEMIEFGMSIMSIHE